MIAEIVVPRPAEANLICQRQDEPLACVIAAHAGYQTALRKMRPREVRCLDPLGIDCVDHGHTAEMAHRHDDARRIFRYGCEKQDFKACGYLARHLLRRGHPHDLAQARVLSEMSCAQGEAIGCFVRSELAWVRDDLARESSNPADAIPWLEKACTANYFEACDVLASIFFGFFNGPAIDEVHGPRFWTHKDLSRARYFQNRADALEDILDLNE